MSGPTLKLTLAWERSGTGNDLEHVASAEWGGRLRTWRIVQKRGSGRYRLFFDGEKFGPDDTASRLKARAEAETARLAVEVSRAEPDPAPQTVAGGELSAAFREADDVEAEHLVYALGCPSDEEPARVTPVEDRDAWPDPADLTALLDASGQPPCQTEADESLTAAAYRAAGLTDPDDETKEQPPLPPEDDDGAEAYRRRAAVARGMAAECASPIEKAVWEAEAEDAEWHLSQAAAVPVADDSPSGV